MYKYLVNNCYVYLVLEFYFSVETDRILTLYGVEI
jgi:hypothetical protein